MTEERNSSSKKYRYSISELKALQDSVSAKFRPAYFDSQFITPEGLFDPIKWFDMNRSQHQQRSASEPRRSNRRPLGHNYNYGEATPHISRPNSRSYRNNTSVSNRGNKENNQENVALGEPSAGRQILQLLQGSGKFKKSVRISEPPKETQSKEDLENLSKALKEVILGQPKIKENHMKTVQEIEATMGNIKRNPSNVSNDASGDRSAFYRLLGALHSQIASVESNGLGSQKAFKNMSPSPKEKFQSLNGSSTPQSNSQRNHVNPNQQNDESKDNFVKQDQPVAYFNQQWMAPFVSKQIANSAPNPVNSSRNALSARSCISQYAPNEQIEPDRHMPMDPMANFQNQINCMPQQAMSVLAYGMPPSASLLGAQSPAMAAQMQNWFSLYCRLANLAAQSGFNQPINNTNAGGYALGVSPALIQRYMANQDNLATFLLRPDQLQAQMRYADISVRPQASQKAVIH